MAPAPSSPEQQLLAQAGQLRDWLADLSAADFAAPSVLPEWDVRTLTGHLVLVLAGLIRALDEPTGEAPVDLHELVRRYRRDVSMIMDRTRTVTADHDGPELVAQLDTELIKLGQTLPDKAKAPKVIMTPRGPGRWPDFVATRILDLVVHADDLSRSFPDRDPVVIVRPALATTVRTLAAILAAQQPGRSIEVRVPPFAAVQCGIGDPGPVHTRGTPPNVVETDPITFIRLTTGRTSWAETQAAGAVHASGPRADLSAALPVLS